MAKTWQTYEQVAQQLLSEVRAQLGLSEVQGKQKLKGNMSGTTWEIDAKGVDHATGQIVVLECRRYPTSRLDQDALAGLAWRILDLGAQGGITVSPLPLQEGAQLVAAVSNVVQVQLNEDATATEFEMRFLDQIRLGFHDQACVTVTDHLTITVTRNGVTEPVEVIGDGPDAGTTRAANSPHADNGKRQDKGGRARPWWRFWP